MPAAAEQSGYLIYKAYPDSPVTIDAAYAAVMARKPAWMPSAKVSALNGLLPAGSWCFRDRHKRTGSDGVRLHPRGTAALQFAFSSSVLRVSRPVTFGDARQIRRRARGGHRPT